MLPIYKNTWLKVSGELIVLFILVLLFSCETKTDFLLNKSDFKYYIDKFNEQDPKEFHKDIVPGTKMISNAATWKFQMKVTAENEIKKMIPVPVQNVRVGGEMGRRIDQALENNILQLDVDKYLLE